MAENQSPNVLLAGFSQEDSILSKVEREPADLTFGILDSGVDEEYALLTPEQNPGLQKLDSPGYTSETFLCSVSGSSDIYTKESSDTAWSSPSSSSDAESGTYDLPTKSYVLQHANGDEALQPKVIDLEFETRDMEENHHIANEEGREGMLEEKEVLYEELLEKVANYEAELKSTKKRFESSQEEIARLKYENLTLVEELGGSIEKLRISEDNLGEMEKSLRNGFEEQKQLQDQLDLANQNIALLQAELGSERMLVSELQKTIDKTMNDLNSYGREAEELKLALHDAQKDFSKDRSQFQNDITCLNEQRDALELRNKLLEEQIKLYEVEKIEAGRLQEARETCLLDENKQLIQYLDASKLKYDMLMADRDEVFAKLQKLDAELNVRDTNMQKMEERISKLTAEHLELIDELEQTQKLVQEFRLKITDQELELEKQRAVICDRAEEKREAIRQLCFSLEYYRNGYHELCQAFMKYKQPALLAA